MRPGTLRRHNRPLMWTCGRPHSPSAAIVFDELAKGSRAPIAVMLDRYDTCCSVALAAGLSCELRFDPTIMLFGLSAHTAARHIRVGPFVDKASNVTNSVIAGCALAVKW